MTSPEVAVLTGAMRRIGRPVTHTLADHGFRVVVADIDAEAAAAAAEEFSADSGPHLFVVTDLRRHGDIVGLLEDVKDRFGLLDVSVNNAPTNRVRDLSDVTAAEWDACSR